MKSEEFRRLAAAPVSRKKQVHRVVRAADGVCDAADEIARPSQTLAGDVARVIGFQRLRRVALAVDAVTALCHGGLLALRGVYRNCQQRGSERGRPMERAGLTVSESFMGF